MTSKRQQHALQFEQDTSEVDRVLVGIFIRLGLVVNWVVYLNKTELGVGNIAMDWLLTP
jgi:hypothetical protein